MAPGRMTKLKRRVGNAIEASGKRKVAEARQRALKKTREALQDRKAIDRIKLQPNLGVAIIGMAASFAEEAEKVAHRLHNKANRIEKRHASGRVGKLTRKLKK